MEQKNTLIQVFWFDATSTDEWTDRSNIKSELNLIHTVGILIEETKEVIGIALNHDTDSDSFSCFIHIPKAWIKSRKVLK